MNQRRLAIAISFAMTGLHAPAVLSAGLTGNNIEEIIVLGDNNALTGDPQTATEGLVFGTQLLQRPISRPAELLEFIPGVIATQHSGEGKANQYFLRGFNLDHGTDLAMRVDGMPVNMPTHAHGQGYADINFVIPELVEWLAYRKGPYYANIGDFATAGSTEFHYTDRLEDGLVSLTAGENDFQRLFAGQSFATGSGGHLTLAGALTRYAGPWQLDQDLDKRKGLIKYHQQRDSGSWAVTAMTYHNDWTATDQIPLRAVQDGSIDRFGNIDPTAGGESRRSSLSFSADQQWGAGDLDFSAYVMDYQLDLFSNFTYFLEDPVRGDQFQQADDRRVYGFDTSYRIETEVTGVPSEISIGLQSRLDDIDVGLYKTQQRIAHTVTREDSVAQSLSSAWISLQQQWHDNFRTVLGLRADHYRFDVDADIAINSGTGSESLLSPKLNFIYSPAGHTEYFFSVGQGFHSNDARGTTIRIDPVSGDAADTVDPLAKAQSVELGLRSSIIPRTQIALSAFTMTLDSELVYVGDAGATEALDKSKRRGLEFSAVYAATDWLLIDADFTLTRARFSGVGADNRIPNSVAKTASLGLSVVDAENWSGGLRVRYLGDAPLIESGRPTSDGTFLVNMQSTYSFTPNLSATLEVLNMFDSDDRDITYFYESQLPGELTAQEDIHFHPVEPRSLRLSLNMRF